MSPPLKNENSRNPQKKDTESQDSYNLQLIGYHKAPRIVQPRYILQEVVLLCSCCHHRQHFNNNKMSEAERWEREAREYTWDARSIPEEFSTPQDSTDWACYQCPHIEWWNTRSPLFCCFFPCFNCYTGAKVVDGTDHTVWKEQLEKNQNGPESMRGVWWLKYNHAHEQLVMIFNETEFIGEINEDGTDGYGRWLRPLDTSWSRDNTCFGHILVTFAKANKAKVGGMYNMKDGILTMDPPLQWIFRVNDNEWCKSSYEFLLPILFLLLFVVVVVVVVALNQSLIYKFFLNQMKSPYLILDT